MQEWSTSRRICTGAPGCISTGPPIRLQRVWLLLGQRWGGTTGMQELKVRASAQQALTSSAGRMRAAACRAARTCP